MQYLFYLISLLVFQLSIFSIELTADELRQRETIRLPELAFKKEDVIYVSTGVRPCRKGGIRIEREKFKDKNIYHNYGAGGSGATLAPGAANRVVQLFLDDNPDVTKPIMIIGGGYAAMLTIKRLIDKGYKNIHVFATHLPERTDYDCDPEYTSYIAGGYWMPFSIEYTDFESYKNIQEQSWNQYKGWIENKTYEGLSFRDAYSVSKEDPTADPSLAKGLMTSHRVNIQFGNNKTLKPGWAFRTILMEGPVFLNSLYKDFLKKGVKFAYKTFSSIEEIVASPYKTIFNCTGNSGASLWNDKDMQGIKGQLVHVRKKPMDCFLFGDIKFGTDKNGNDIFQHVSIYPSSNKTSIGYVKIEKFDNLNPDSAVTIDLLNRAHLLVSDE